VGFIYQQYYITREENNPVHDPQAPEKKSIPPAPTATCRCNLCKGEGYYVSTCEIKGKADTDLRYRIVPATNMEKIYPYLKDGLKKDPDFRLIAHFDNDDRMWDAYITCIRICSMWSQLYNTSYGKKGVSKDKRFLIKKN